MSRLACRDCWPESLSEVPENVARLDFPRPLEGSSRRRGLVDVDVLEEPVLAERLVIFGCPEHLSDPTLSVSEWHRPFPTRSQRLEDVAHEFFPKIGFGPVSPTPRRSGGVVCRR